MTSGTKPTLVGEPECHRVYLYYFAVQAGPSWSCDLDYFIYTLVPPSYRCFILIGRVVSEGKIFEDDGRTPDHGVIYVDLAVK